MTDEQTDARLHQLLLDIAQLKESETEIARALRAAWDEAFSIFDDVAGEGQPFRYLDVQERQVFGRQVRQGGSRVDPDKLKEVLTPRQWKRVTHEETRVVLDEPKLQAEVVVGRIPADKVNEATIWPEPVVARFGPREATKEENEQLDIREGREARQAEREEAR